MMLSVARFKLAAVAMTVFVGAAGLADEPELKPFVMRWDDTEKTLLDLSFLSPGEAGVDGPVTVSDEGYLVTGTKRLKLFGNNTGPGTLFADEVSDGQRNAFAGRLRKFGFNAMRLHHIGASWTPRNIFGPTTTTPDNRPSQVDAESLDRFHRWIAAFKRHGIYINQNLLVSRTFRPADGLPESIDDIGWKLQGAVACWHPRMIELQKDFARQILEPINPHTGLSLADDPALATVEINNENGILHTWLSGEMDDIPADLAEPLRTMWNDWLTEKHSDDAALADAWNAVDAPLGEPLIEGFAGFNLNAQGGAAASVDGAGGATRVTIDATGTQGWHVQFTRGLALKAGKPYTLTFRAKADSPRTILVGARMNHDPWTMLGLEQRIDLTGEWQDFSITFVPTASDDNGRIEFGDLSQEGATYDFEGLSLRPGGTFGLPENARLADNSMPLPTKSGAMTLQHRRDWFAFCMDAERAYFGEMRRFLKEDLGVVAPVVGTIVGCSPMGVQKEMDAIDTHAYWRHPDFPGESWDMHNWTVRPDSMVDFPETSAILGTMLKQVRVDGVRKPHMVTEYDHPAPNPHAGEAPLFLAAYGALQDFDAIYLFNYDLEPEAGKINGFFDTANHPTVMANCIPAALMFRRGDVQPAEREAVVSITSGQELDALVQRGGAWGMVDYTAFVEHEGARITPYVFRVATDFAGEPRQPQVDVESLTQNRPLPTRVEWPGMFQWLVANGTLRADWFPQHVVAVSGTDTLAIKETAFSGIAAASRRTYVEDDAALTIVPKRPIGESTYNRSGAFYVIEGELDSRTPGLNRGVRLLVYGRFRHAFRHAATDFAGDRRHRLAVPGEMVGDEAG